MSLKCQLLHEPFPLTTILIMSYFLRKTNCLFFSTRLARSPVFATFLMILTYLNSSVGLAWADLALADPAPATAEIQKGEGPQAEGSKAETPKAETPNVEAPKAGVPKAGVPKAETAELPKATTREIAAAQLFVISPASAKDYEEKIAPLFKTQLEVCSKCQVTNSTPYKEGVFDSSRLPSQIDGLPRQGSILVLLWNQKYVKDNDPWVASVRKAIQEGLIVVASAGRPQSAQPTLTLSRTLWGQIPDVILIGELEETERLGPGTFFGPEMLTALKPLPTSEIPDLGALQFSIRLLGRVKSHPTNHWVSYLRERKAKLRKFWPALGDFFDR
ncbi:MAG: hypothetical protein C5B49_12185 [Bdellovibrio sp.]|nr:MAG: hypothetical protein C5B49_12185 [Bdellovibrio sp.]